MTDTDKIKAIGNSPEVIKAIKLLTACFVEMELKSIIRYSYDIPGYGKFELTYLKITNEVEIKKEE